MPGRWRGRGLLEQGGAQVGHGGVSLAWAREFEVYDMVVHFRMSGAQVGLWRAPGNWQWRILSSTVSNSSMTTPLSVEGVFQMDYILPERLLALVRPAFDLVLRI